MRPEPGETWIERNNGTQHKIVRVTRSFVFHLRGMHEKVERTRVNNFMAHCRKES